MNQYFQYSVLKYRPSYILDERVNIGLLFCFTKANNQLQFEFVFPSRLGRISHSFPNLEPKNLHQIKTYLRAFKEVSAKISTSTNDKLELAIPQHFLIDDANSFFFSKVKEGFYESIEETLTYYQQLYFKFYDQRKSRKTQDAVVKERFEDSLKSLVKPNDIRLSYFEKGINIENKITHSKFEYLWQNGTPNLVKTLGFDLSHKQDIQDKAFKWSSAISYINKVDTYQDYHFDILVGRPKKQGLFNAYDVALEILDDIKAPKSIIEEEGIKSYAEKTLSDIRPFQDKIT